MLPHNEPEDYEQVRVSINGIWMTANYTGLRPPRWFLIEKQKYVSTTEFTRWERLPPHPKESDD